jgi:NAD(P)-dependent dehydrogenase (short-subunit alcohol dehydrogenase family)
VLKNKVVFITGGGRGIGAAVAQLMADRGALVFIGSRNKTELFGVTEKIRKQNGICENKIVDVRSPTQVEEAFAFVRSTLGPVDILVNCAGAIENARAEQTSLAVWNEIQSINVTGTFLCCQQALLHFSGRSGAIINVSSLGGISGTEKFPGYCAYTTSKFAVIGLTEALAAEYKQLPIRINCIAPGAVDTAMLKKADPRLKTKTQPHDIAKLITFLADSDESGSLTGVTLPVYSNL